MIPAPKHNKFKCATPIEFLKFQIAKKTMGEDAKDENDAVIEEQEVLEAKRAKLAARAEKLRQEEEETTSDEDGTAKQKVLKKRA